MGRLALCLVLSLCLPLASSMAQPRPVEEVLMVLLREPTVARMALEKGEVDLLSDVVEPANVEALRRASGVRLHASRGFHMFYLCFNARRSPWDREEVRQAVALSIPRDRLVAELFQGLALPMESFVVDISPFFEPDFPRHPFDPEGARRRLREGGFRVEGGRLVSPDGRVMGPFKVLCPTAEVAPTSAAMAQGIARAVSSALGLSVEAEMMDFPSLVERVQRRDFDMFVMAWSLSKNPDYLHSFFHSESDVEGGYNLPGLRDPKLDEVLKGLLYARDREEARLRASQAQRILAELLPYVPLYTRYLISAHSDRLEGLVDARGAGVDNFWSYLGMRVKRGEGRLRVALREEPRNLNPLVASSAYEWQVLGLIYESLLASHPATLEEVPWLAESFDVQIRREGDAEKHELLFLVREGVRWHDGRPLTAEDVAFTLRYLAEKRPPRYLDAVKDLEEVSVEGRLVRVRMKGISYWYLSRIGGLPVLPAHVWSSVEDYRSFAPWRGEGGEHALVGSGPFRFVEYREGRYVRLRRFDGHWFKGDPSSPR